MPSIGKFFHNQKVNIMTANRSFVVYALCTTLGVLSTSVSANATCALAGTWQFFGIEGKSPAIKDISTNVGNTTNNGSTQIKSFPLTGKPFENDTADVIACTLTVAANGSFTGPCSSFAVTAGNSGPATVSGTFALNACNLTGTIDVAGEPPAVTIQRGRINFNSTGGSGIATKGGGRVLYFTLVK